MDEATAAQGGRDQATLDQEAAPPGFAEAVRFWAKLGWINFGGPAGQIAIMHDELVDRRHWVAESTFLHGLNYCMLLPGPEAMQLATWLGWRLHGVRGGVAAGVLFVLPAALLMALLGWVYMRFGQVPLVAGALFGVQAAVLGIIVHALLRIGRRVLKTPFALLLAVLAALALGVIHLPFPAVVLGAGVVGVAVARFAPRWLPASD
jgi:chromate transporter